MTWAYNDSRIKIKTGVWDKDKIDIYNNEYYGYSSYYSNNRYYIEDNDGNDNDLNDDEENIKVKVRIRIKVIIRLKLKVKQEYINNRVYMCKLGVDEYNNDINKYNIECNNNRVKENRECGILDIEYLMFIGVSRGVCTATPGSQSKSWTTPAPDNNKKPTSHINKKPSFGRKGFCPWFINVKNYHYGKESSKPEC